MTLALEGVQTTLAPMTPDGSVRWEQNFIPSVNGTLYTAPDCPEDIIDTTLSLHGYTWPGSLGFEPVGVGEFANVFRKGEVAYKKHNLVNADKLFGLSEVVANVSLQAGLDRLHESGQPDAYFHGGSVVMTAPRYYAALLPGEAQRYGTPSVFVVAMSLEHGTPPKADDVPPADRRLAICEAAVRACKLLPEWVNFDDDDRYTHQPVNELLSKDVDGSLHIAKIDVRAKGDYFSAGTGVMPL